tara:strand:- start:297 stop:785 length:489 start_codon:yes stop_codon:yes gene_type:complete
MFSKLLSSQTIIYNLILFICFSLSVNYFVSLELVNFLSYVFFHLTLIYLVFYFFHFSIILISFLYGIFFDIFLIDFISPHLISFLVFVLLFYYNKKYLLNFSSNTISYIIIIVTLAMFILETLIANLFFNYPINYQNLGWLFLTAIIIFFPSLFLFSKIDKL